MAKIWQFEDIVPGWIEKIASRVDSKPDGYALVGLLHDGGTDLSGLVFDELLKLGYSLPVGRLDARASLPDDDYSIVEQPSSIDYQVDGTHIIMVQDVFTDGKISRAGFNRIFSYWRPGSIELACLVEDDKVPRAFPIKPDYSALSPGIEGYVFSVNLDKRRVVAEEHIGQII